jgi:hypothetical protein
MFAINFIQNGLNRSRRMLNDILYEADKGKVDLYYTGIHELGYLVLR